MNTARIVVLTVATGTGAIAAYLASGSNRPARPPAVPTAQLPTPDVVVAKSDIGPGQVLKPEDMQWQTWPAGTANAEMLARARQSGTPSLALRSFADVNAKDDNADEPARRRDEAFRSFASAFRVR